MRHIVRALYRFPVKSLGGEALESSTITSTGIDGDRYWAVRDDERGGIHGAKRFPKLMDLGAKLIGSNESADAEITFPDGRLSLASDPEINGILSTYLDHPVSLWPRLPADQLEHYKRGKPVLSDAVEELRQVFVRERNESLPDLSSFPQELTKFSSIPGTYFDALPILIMTANSLRNLQNMASESQFDVRRFRPNILVECESDNPYPELDWIGKTLQIGGTQLVVKLECPRCIMTTHGFSDLPQDKSIMRTLVKNSGGNLGVYAEIQEPGRIHIGDQVTTLH